MDHRREPSGPTEVIGYIHTVAVSILAICGLFYLIFTTPAVSNFIFTGALILASLLICGVIFLVKLFVDYLHRRYEVSELTEYRNNVLIGTGGISICSGAVKVCSFFMLIDGKTFLFLTFLYLLTVSFFFFTFNFVAANRVTGKSEPDQKGGIFLASYSVAQIVLLIVTIRIAVEYDDPDFILVLIICQVFCGIVFGMSSTEFLYVLMVGVKFLRGYTPKPERQEATVKVTFKKEKKVKKSKTAPAESKFGARPTCNICLIQFSDTGSQVPRMLSRCGHTICEGCAGNLLKSSFFILCPFCQQKTVVNGSAGLLPKNFALLELMEEGQQNVEDQIYQV